MMFLLLEMTKTIFWEVLLLFNFSHPLVISICGLCRSQHPRDSLYADKAFLFYLSPFLKDEPQHAKALWISDTVKGQQAICSSDT